MNRIPLLAKNAYLKLFYTQQGIYAKLAYSHYDIARGYFLDDFTNLQNYNGKLDLEFWKNYFKQLERHFDWNLFEITDDIVQLHKFSDEGDGVHGVKLFYESKSLPGLDFLANSILNLEYEEFSENKIEMALNSFGKKFGYDDLLWLDVNFAKITLHRLRIENSTERNTLFKSIKSKSFSKNEIISVIKDSKLTAFMSESINVPVFKNAWANHVTKGYLSSDNTQINDIYRAYITIQLLSLITQNQGFLKNFGVGQYDNELYNFSSTIIVTGNMVENMKERDLFLSILDGLQLEGVFDIYFDSNRNYQMYGDSYMFGINANDIILSKKDVIPYSTRVIIPEVSNAKTNRQVVMSGTMSDPNQGGIAVYALTPEITPLNVNIKNKMYYDLRFVRGSYLKGIGEKLEFIVDPEKHLVEKVYIDCRPKPVIYGPDSKNNKNKISQWFS